MTGLAAIAILALAAALAPTPPAPAGGAAPSNPWTSQNVLVYGEKFVVDFSAGVEKGPWTAMLNTGAYNSTLRNCSNDEFICARADGPSAFNVVLPRRCARWQVGQNWSRDTVTTTVLALQVGDDKLNFHYPLPRYYLVGSSDRPHTVFVYFPPYGVVEIFTDASSRLNLVEIAKSGGLRGLRAEDLKPNRIDYTLVTLEGAGACVE